MNFIFLSEKREELAWKVVLVDGGGGGAAHIVQDTDSPY